jgi:hypothetical protein
MLVLTQLVCGRRNTEMLNNHDKFGHTTATSSDLSTVNWQPTFIT